MDINEIRASGLLELYALGQCSAEEIATVEKALQDHAGLREDYEQICISLERYAQLHRVQPSDHVKADLLQKLKESNRLSSTKTDDLTPRSRQLPGWLGAMLGFGLILLGYVYYTSLQKVSTLQAEIDEIRASCDSLQNNLNATFATLDILQDRENQILPLSATEAYASTELFLVYNPQKKANFLEVSRLPGISPDQSFQLWSLKEGVAPIPLTVFQGDEGLFIPVDFEEGTQTYAITIEPRGGSQSPTLERLIATVSVG